jgi:hypothetical protein
MKVIHSKNYTPKKDEPKPIRKDPDISRLEHEIESVEREINRYAEALSGEAKPAAGTDKVSELRLARIVIMDALSAATKHTTNREQLKGIARERLRWHYKIEWCGEIEREFETVLKQIKK